jgi:hypothetical protein
MALALRIRDLDEDTFAASAVSSKQCSGCDPDVPGHCSQHRCLKCRGTGREPLSFQSTVMQLADSKKEALRDAGGKGGKKFEGRGKSQSCDYGTDGDDDVQGDLDY